MDNNNYTVSFNNEEYDIGGYEDGETEDYYGPDVDRLADHVIKSDPDFPMVFKRADKDDGAVGYFYDATDKDFSRSAVMYKGNPVLPTFVK